MGAYNRFNGTHCCANSYLLRAILKDEWGFRGLVMSDWGAVHSTEETAGAGLDLARIAHKVPAAKRHSTAVTGRIGEPAICSVSTRQHRGFANAPHTDGSPTLLATKICERCGLEMPGPGNFFAEPLKKAVDDGKISEEVLDDKVRRILRVMSTMGLLDVVREAQRVLFRSLPGPGKRRVVWVSPSRRHRREQREGQPMEVAFSSTPGSA